MGSTTTPRCRRVCVESLRRSCSLLRPQVRTRRRGLAVGILNPRQYPPLAPVARRPRPDAPQSRPNQMKFGLPLQCPPHHAIGADNRVLFLRHANGLVVPFGNARGRLQLDRKPHVRDDAMITTAWDAVLIVPQSDDRARTV